MYEKQEIKSIQKSELLEQTKKLCDDGYRLVQICCTKLDHLQLDYTFDKEYQFYGLRLKLGFEKPELPSISGVYLAACLYENELHDLFGIKVDGMAIDFGGKFYRITKENPFMNVDNIDVVTNKE